MKNIKVLERLQRLNELIKQEKTGTPKEIATKFNISQRAVHNLIEHLKDFEAPICYSRSRKTYYYCKEFDICVSVSLTILNGKEQIQIFGGSYFFNKNLLLQGFCTE